jgi:hypothetical protein
MIDIGKKITFCKMFENVKFFSLLHFKIAKSAIMKIINMGIKETQNCVLISNSLMPT